MNDIVKYFTPFTKLTQNEKYIVIAVQLSLFFLAWQFIDINFVPKPLEVLSEINRMRLEDSLIAELWISLKLCISSMLIAIVLSALISYASTIPAFRNLSLIVSNFRFLSLFGLSFYFTVFTSGADSLKTSLLVFSITVFFVDSFIVVIDKIDEGQWLLAKTLGMNDWKTLFYVVIYGKLDSLFSIISGTFAISWVMLSTIENLAKSGGGIAVLLFNENKYLHLGGVVGAQLIIFGLGMLLVYLIKQGRLLTCPHTKYEGI